MMVSYIDWDRNPEGGAFHVDMLWEVPQLVRGDYYPRSESPFEHKNSVLHCP